jgi:hypothetical protein
MHRPSRARANRLGNRRTLRLNNLMIENFCRLRRGRLLLCLTLGGALLGGSCSRAQDLVPLNIKLPSPAFIGTPSDKALPPNVEPLSKTPRPPFLAPAGVTNVALHQKVTSSATNAAPEDLAKITDGEKEATEENVVLLTKGSQWVQIDLEKPREIYAIVVWHAHSMQKIYHGVVVQIADGPGFTPADNVRALFNNDIENLDGQGVGKDREYFETNEGKLIDAHGAKARYVRLYSDGSTAARYNEYTEVEVYGRPAK